MKKNYLLFFTMTFIVINLLFTSCGNNGSGFKSSRSTEITKDSISQWRTQRKSPKVSVKENDETRDQKDDEKRERTSLKGKHSNTSSFSKTSLKHPEAVKFLLEKYQSRYENLLDNPSPMFMKELDDAVEHYLITHFDRTDIDFINLGKSMGKNPDSNLVIIKKKTN